jgi:hypothetical protein
VKRFFGKFIILFHFFSFFPFFSKNEKYKIRPENINCEIERENLSSTSTFYKKSGPYQQKPLW